MTFSKLHAQLITSPIPIITQDASERAEATARLRKDYFDNTWDQLPKQAREKLVECETEWRHSRYDNMVKDIRPLLEISLIDVFPFLKGVAQQNDPRLILTRIRDALNSDINVTKSIDALQLPRTDSAWLKNDLPKFLHTVIEARNFFEKDQTKYDRESAIFREMLDKAAYIHHRLVGIGREGVLPRLIKIKIMLKCGDKLPI